MQPQAAHPKELMPAFRVAGGKTELVVAPAGPRVDPPGGETHFRTTSPRQARLGERLASRPDPRRPIDEAQATPALDPPLAFNNSHAGAWVLLGVERGEGGEVGVDLMVPPPDPADVQDGISLQASRA